MADSIILVHNLGMGTALVAITVLMHTTGLILVAAVTPVVARRLGLHDHGAGRTLVMAGMVLGILAILTAEVWLWAIGYRQLGVVGSFGDALYLSTAMFSTIGYGEVHPHLDWRLLTALEGINGFLMIGWSTAYLVRASTLHGPFRAQKHF